MVRADFRIGGLGGSARVAFEISQPSQSAPSHNMAISGILVLNGRRIDLSRFNSGSLSAVPQSQINHNNNYQLSPHHLHIGESSTDLIPIRLVF